MIYAQTPARRGRQLLGDAMVAGWTIGWVAIAWWLHRQLLRLEAPGRSLENAGHDLADSLNNAGRRVGDLPLAGDALRKPFTAAAQAGRTLEQAGAAQRDVVGHLAFWLPLVLAAPPILYVLGRWLIRRLRWMRQANAAAQLQASSVDLDLFALRALARQPMSQLRRLGPDPAGAWRRGDPATVRDLADLELRELGLQAGSLD